jgi:hypothetical protein
MHLFAGVLMAVTWPGIHYYCQKKGNDRKKLIHFFHEIPSIPAGGCSLSIKGAFFIPATGHHGSASLMPGTG